MVGAAPAPPAQPAAVSGDAYTHAVQLSGDAARNRRCHPYTRVIPSGAEPEDLERAAWLTQVLLPQHLQCCGSNSPPAPPLPAADTTRHA
jgi:hypothetical protein